MKSVKFADGAIFYTHANPRKHINAGYPTILTLTDYSSLKSTYSSIADKNYHTVVAYGYNKEKDWFYVHLGYSPMSTVNAKVIISNVSIYSYNTVYI